MAEISCDVGNGDETPEDVVRKFEAERFLEANR